MIKRNVIILTPIVLVFLVVLYFGILTSPAHIPAMQLSEEFPDGSPVIADGTFIQWWLVKDWDDEKWMKEFSILKEADMQYIVLAPTAIYETDKETNRGKTKTVYPTKLEWAEVMKDGSGDQYHDVVDACLKNAQKAGMKVFLGLNFSDEWWVKRRDASWIYDRMLEGNQIADELWELYYHKYSDAFYGWYWCWEVDNLFFKRYDLFNSVKVLSNAIKIHMDHFDATNRHLPFMLSPYMNRFLGTASGNAKMWEYVFANSGMREGDIFCPQDCIGTGSLNLNNLTKWFAELRKAVDTKPGIRFWADIETYNISDWSGAPLDRFVKQMELLKPYVENYITFSYSHYYSPNIVDDGFHKTYVQYIETGKLESHSPTAPTSLKAVVKSVGRVYLSWNAASDNIGICGYYVFRNGEKITNIQVFVKDTGNRSLDAVTNMIDKVPKLNTAYTYEIQAYDFAGNVSDKTEPVTVQMR